MTASRRSRGTGAVLASQHRGSAIARRMVVCGLITEKGTIRFELLIPKVGLEPGRQHTVHSIDPPADRAALIAASGIRREPA
jgi:hypothetical protein